MNKKYGLLCLFLIAHSNLLFAPVDHDGYSALATNNGIDAFDDTESLGVHHPQSVSWFRRHRSTIAGSLKVGLAATILTGLGVGSYFAFTGTQKESKFLNAQVQASVQTLNDTANGGLQIWKDTATDGIALINKTATNLDATSALFLALANTTAFAARQVMNNVGSNAALVGQVANKTSVQFLSYMQQGLTYFKSLQSNAESLANSANTTSVAVVDGVQQSVNYLASMDASTASVAQTFDARSAKFLEIFNAGLQEGLAHLASIGASASSMATSEESMAVSAQELVRIANATSVQGLAHLASIDSSAASMAASGASMAQSASTGANDLSVLKQLACTMYPKLNGC